PLIAYNIDLNTNNKEIANKIAKKIRFSSGGIPFVQAKAAQLISRGNVQVTINLINYHETSLWKVFSAVKQEAELLGFKAISSEIIGLIPQEALLLSLREILGEDIDIDLERLIFLTKKYFLLRDFDEEKILDYYLNKIMDGKYE
ncbi:MAG: glutamate formiminotransferase, partial [Bacilli bacterium]|nr:glutamate formiminotransferase [Bacilli bacterium]